MLIKAARKTKHQVVFGKDHKRPDAAYDFVQVGEDFVSEVGDTAHAQMLLNTGAYFAVSSHSTGTVAVIEASPDDEDRDSVVAEFTRVVGTKPHHKMSVKKMREVLAEMVK